VLLRAYDAENRFIAIARQEQRGGWVVLRPEKVFVHSSPHPAVSSPIAVSPHPPIPSPTRGEGE
jgi:hypothetical protein